MRDIASVIRRPSQLREVVKQRGMDMLAESHHPVAGTLAGRAPGRGEHQEMEQLAEKLVAPLARLLRTELRMDRERMGRLRDSGR